MGLRLIIGLLRAERPGPASRDRGCSRRRQVWKASQDWRYHASYAFDAICATAYSSGKRIAGIMLAASRGTEVAPTMFIAMGPPGCKLAATPACIDDGIGQES
jgi:hypothetical protein